MQTKVYSPYINPKPITRACDRKRTNAHHKRKYIATPLFALHPRSSFLGISEALVGRTAEGVLQLQAEHCILCNPFRGHLNTLCFAIDPTKKMSIRLLNSSNRGSYGCVKALHWSTTGMKKAMEAHQCFGRISVGRVKAYKEMVHHDACDLGPVPFREAV